MTPAQKAHDTKVFKLCRILAVAMADLPTNHDLRDVLALWKYADGSKRIKADAFQVMDNQPARFERYTEWHPRLRSLRNHPTHGPELFATFN